MACTLVLMLSGGTLFAQSRGEPIFNPGFEEKRKEDAKSKKKIVVPSFTRHIKTMREICQAMESDGRLADFQKVAGAQPNFSLDCPTCRPFFRIWFSSCQIAGTGNLKFSPPEEPTPTPAETAIVPVVGASGEGTPTAVGTGTPVASVESTPTVEPTPTEVPAADEGGGEDGASEEGGEEGKSAPTPTPTPRPIGPERDPNIVVLDLVSRLFQNLADAPGAELSMMAVDLFVGELRNPAGKTESAQAYFDTVAEFMLAPFESVRAEFAASLAAQKEVEQGEGAPPEANVNEMFDF